MPTALKQQQSRAHRMAQDIELTAENLAANWTNKVANGPTSINQTCFHKYAPKATSKD